MIDVHVLVDRDDGFRRAPALAGACAHPSSRLVSGRDGVPLVGLPAGRPVAVRRLRSGSARQGDLTQLARARDLPHGARCANWSRFPVAADRCQQTEEAVFALMACAVMDHCLAAGLEWVGGVEQLYRLLRWDSPGRNIRVLGLPCRIDGVSSVAAFAKVDAANLASARRPAGLRHAPLRAARPDLSAPPLSPFSPHRPEIDHAC